MLVVYAFFQQFVLKFNALCVFLELPHPPLITSVELSSTSPNAVDITWTPGFDGNSLLLRFTIDFRRVVIGMSLVSMFLARPEIFMLTAS